MGKKTVAALLCLLLLLSGCGSAAPAQPDAAPEASPSFVPVSAPIYRQERAPGELPEATVECLYLTVKEGTTEETDHSWEEINAYSAADYAAMGVERYKIAGWLQEGTEEGPLGSLEEAPGCTVSFRGQSSSTEAQKSYKVKLQNGTWMGQKTLNLNKHATDNSRILNKLAYDLIDEVPQLIGLQTQFVHLFVKDLSQGADPETAEFVDYGLYTHVEQLNNQALRRLDLGEDCSLYKVNNFEFWEYDDVKLTTDPDFNLANFEVRLENKGATDNEKLIALMDAVCKGEVSDEELLGRYVEKENFAYWMALQILLDNVDTCSRNFYLYSPADGEKWYIISWDNDGAFSHMRAELVGFEAVPWRSGVTDYWGSFLFRRLLRIPEFRDALVAAAADLKENYLTEEHIRALRDLYTGKTEGILRSSRDESFINWAIREKMLDRIPGEIEAGYARLLDSLKRPSPYFIGSPQYNAETGEVLVNWDASYDFNGQHLTYTVEVTDDPRFETVLLTRETDENQLTYPHEWGPGTYFLRVTARNEDGYTMGPLNQAWSEEIGHVFGAQTYAVEG